jgi:hypothetical protein
MKYFKIFILNFKGDIVLYNLFFLVESFPIPRSSVSLQLLIIYILTAIQRLAIGVDARCLKKCVVI